VKRYPAPREAWVVMPDAYGPAEYLERIGYSVAEVRAAWSKRYQRIKRAKCSRDICIIHAETIRTTAAMRPIAKDQGADK
jgi:hypothetical protein